MTMILSLFALDLATQAMLITAHNRNHQTRDRTMTRGFDLLPSPWKDDTSSTKHGRLGTLRSLNDYRLMVQSIVVCSHLKSSHGTEFGVVGPSFL